MHLENEISSGLGTDFDELEGLRFRDIENHAKNSDSSLYDVAKKAVRGVLQYPITTVHLSGTIDVEEFNLQFLRLNLGTLINAGEKLHAMVGGMRDVVFKDDRIGKHDFFEWVRMPTRRYARELTAAQVLLQIFSYSGVGEFARARHVELQRFLKEHEELDPMALSLIQEGKDTLDALSEGVADAADYLRNRAVTVSLILLAWRRRVAYGDLEGHRFWAFAEEFMEGLGTQVEKMKAFKEVEVEYQHFVEFQRHLTQASVEKRAVARRHAILSRSLDGWLAGGREGALEGDL